MNKTFLYVLAVAVLVTIFRLAASIYIDATARMDRYAAHETTRHANLAAEERNYIASQQK